MGARTTRYAPDSAEAGRSRVWCSGLCMTGPDYRGTLLTFLLALAIFSAEVAVSFPFLLTNHSIVAVPLLVLLAVSFAVTVWSAYLCSTTDPGIVPRSATLPPSIIAFPNVRERSVIYRGRQIILRFCDTCRVWRPPRSSHCATCNNCVRRFDHHCPWLGNDIGLRNYRSYFTFVVFATLSAAVAITTSVLTVHWTTAHFRAEYPTESYAASIRRSLGFKATSVNLVIILLCFLALLFTGGLTGFHLYLMSNNITTAERFKKRARNSAHPHDDYRGLRAIFFLQCTRRPASALTEGFIGPAYPEEDEYLRLIDAQVEEEKALLDVPVPSIPIAPPRVVSLPVSRI
ncbi:Protein S-acyltransferase 8 [Gracilariopsis chorda]|uniref:Palmitoyltransferase n=1 Tax=Gracilariopsis chorda TaxID=448386 RepID=A0A2V3IH39_9FLOR|nr:Protein S-acyltransferase 8 [Gracilariopsis chorda]|eukprot:PXF41387.1 Protein S-acyltransferase 8 [Gracilariopsis chorda]